MSKLKRTIQIHSILKRTIQIHFYFLQTVPGSDLVLFFMGKFYSMDDRTAWDECKKQAQALVQEKLDHAKLQSIETWHQSMVRRFATCSHKNDVALKRGCLRNLQEDLSGFEPHFRGTSIKQKSLFLKFYQIYVMTFYSVSEMLMRISDSKTKASIQKDIQMKSAIFAPYMKDAIDAAKTYGCRNIKILIQRKQMFWWKTVQYWPASVSYSAFKFQKTFNHLSYRGCGVARQSVMYSSRVYDVKADKPSSDKYWMYEACTHADGISSSVSNALGAWLKELGKCKQNYSPDSLVKIMDTYSLVKTL